MNKKTLMVLIGGKTGEHRVNIISSKYFLPAINREKFEVILVGIDRTGVWYLLDEQDYLVNTEDHKNIEFKPSKSQIALINKQQQVYIIDINNGKELHKVDVVFSLIGGTYAEDGRLQGLLDMVGLAYVGAGVTGSVLGMDKIIQKQILRANNILVTDFKGFKQSECKQINFEELEQKFQYPIFVKPANLGSSVGINKAHDRTELQAAIEEALKYDNKIILEKNISGREIEFAVLGNSDTDIKVSIAGEVKHVSDFYNYETKYLKSDSVEMIIPAELTAEQLKKGQETAVAVYNALDCEGFGRVDMFLTEDDSWMVNEINTIPGFINMSMYPKLMEASGISYSELIDKLIDLAFLKKKRSR